jgi:hypothetical protein
MISPKDRSELSAEIVTKRGHKRNQDDMLANLEDMYKGVDQSLLEASDR